MNDFFVHSHAICETPHVGDRTRIWAFSHILKDAKIGEDCNICDGVFIENDVIVGDRVTIKSGVQLWDGLRVDDDVFIGPNATFTNDAFPRSRKWLETHPITRIHAGASIGANATILPGINIGSGAMIGAGTVVTKDVPANSIVYGNPGRIRGYIRAGNQDSSKLNPRESADIDLNMILPGGARLIRLNNISEVRGNLLAVEFDTDLPFLPERFFMIYDVPSEEVRGGHAHRTCEQVLAILSGTVVVSIDDGIDHKEIFLSDPSIALYIPPMIWGIQSMFSAEAILGVFASQPFDSDDYIGTYEEFQTLLSRI
jgi:acetyltransferase-like isoleucine patch superfamily enzyme/mannose-6-phosphate isomerase-like protein (cupin superfamily)